MKWTSYLENDVCERLANCRCLKSDLQKLVNAKWRSMREHKKDEQGFTKEDALVNVLELLDSNGQYFDLTEEEYQELI